MATKINSMSARKALKPRRNPYFVSLRKGLYVGYRRLEEGDGTWIARRLEPGSKKYLYRSFGVLPSYEDAVKQTESWAGAVDHGVTHKAITLNEACKAYVTHQTTHKTKASGDDAKGRFMRLVYGKGIGKLSLDKLRTTHLRTWMEEQLDEDGDEEDLRRSKDSANRNLNTLKAALNLALKDRLIATDAGWRTVSIYPKAGRRRTGDLTAEDRAELLKACPADLALLTKALMLTGMRPGEIATADVRNFNKARGTLTVTGKTGPRTATLSTAAVDFFTARCTDKLPTAPLLSDEFGNRWNKDSWKKKFRDAVTKAKLGDHVVMYTLRHAAISDMIAGGMDSFLVAKLAGTSTAMIDKHYGHLRHAQTRAKLDAVRLA